MREQLRPSNRLLAVTSDSADLTLVLSAIQICHEAYNVGFDNAAKPIRDLAQEVLDKLGSTTHKTMETFFR